MKLSTIAKTSLALGILTTGVMTTNAQSVSANQSYQDQASLVNPENKALHDYYQKPFYEYKKVSVFKKGNKAFLRTKGRLTNILLSGEDKHMYANGRTHNLDVFTVQEQGNQRVHYSVGGLSRTNFTPIPNWKIDIPYNIYKVNENAQSDARSRLTLHKLQVTLKELDFKLRKKLINENELYENGYKYGDIVINMKNGERHVIDLTKKLPYKKMGVLISTEDIKYMDANLKKIQWSPQVDVSK